MRTRTMPQKRVLIDKCDLPILVTLRGDGRERQYLISPAAPGTLGAYMQSVPTDLRREVARRRK